MGDRAQGAVGSAVSGLTGDQAGQAHYEKMRAEGKEYIVKDGDVLHFRFNV